MNKSKRALVVSKSLNELYPNPPIPLNHDSVFTLLIAVILSAQCTDVRVNLVTPLLFKKANNPRSMIKLGTKEIKRIIKSCGLSPKKSKSIYELSKILVKQHNVMQCFVEQSHAKQHSAKLAEQYFARQTLAGGIWKLLTEWFPPPSKV